MSKKNRILIFLTSLVQKFQKENVLEVFINICFYVLLLVYTYMNVTVYAKSAHTMMEKTVIGAILVSLELVATWLLFKMRDIKVTTKTWYNGLKIAGLLIIYFGLSIPSISSRIAYTISAVKEQSNVVSLKNSDVDQNSIQVAAIDENIRMLQEEKANVANTSTNTNYIVWKRGQLTDKINAQVKERGKYSKLIKDSGGKEVSAIDDAYTEMGKPLKVPGITIFTILLVIRLFSLDVCIILIVFLSRKSKKENVDSLTFSKEKEFSMYVHSHRQNLVKYVDSLMEDERTIDKNKEGAEQALQDLKRRLKKDSDISLETGIPLKLCNEYRHLLKTRFLYGKIPVIVSSRGKTCSNFFKKDIMSIILSYANLY